MRYRAAIVQGPRGPFAVLELSDAVAATLSADDRADVARCFKSKHQNIPVVFVDAHPNMLQAAMGEPVDEDLTQCMSEHRREHLEWLEFAADQ